MVTCSSTHVVFIFRIRHFQLETSKDSVCLSFDFDFVLLLIVLVDILFCHWRLGLTLLRQKKTWIKLFLHSVLLLSFLNMDIGYVFTLFLVCFGHEEHLTKVFVFAMYFTKSFLLI